MPANVVELLIHPDALMPDQHAKVPLDLAPYRALDGLQVAQTTARSVTLASARGQMEISCPAEGMLRVRATPGVLSASVTERLGLVQVPGDPVSFGTSQKDGRLTVQAGGMTAEVDLASGAFSVRDPSGQEVLANRGGLRFSDQPGEYSGHRSFAAFRLDPDERLFGFGGRIMKPDRTGLWADLFAVKAGLYSGDYGGFPVPFMLSSRGYGVFCNNPWPHLYFDLGRTDPGEWWAHAPGGDCDWFVLAGPEFSDLMQRFTSLVGRLPPPRRWWLGFWGGTLSLSTADQVLDSCRRFRAEGLPIDAVHIDGNWRGGPQFLTSYMKEGTYTSADFNWHPDFGDGPGLVKELRSLGIKTVLHVNSRPYSKETTERGVAEGWLRKQGHETVARVGDPASEAKYRELISDRNAEGIGCWLQDHGDRVSGEVLPGIPSRNLFGALWARATTQTGTDDGDPCRVVFTRGSGIGGQRHAIVWSGDTRVGIDFFEEDLWYLINAGLAGYPLSSYDLGGYMFAHKNAPLYNKAFDRDNLARRLCQSLFFMPVPRTQDDAVDPPKFPWNCPPEIDRLYRAFLRLRYRMIPYHFSYLVAAAATGEPIVRPMIYHFRSDRRTWTIHDQCLLGEWLLVAPVVRKGAEHRSVYLPEGRWIDFWRGTVHQGPTVVLADCPFAGVEGLPVFVRAGAILPSQPDADRLPDTPPAEIHLDIYPDGESSFVLRDGVGLATPIVCRQTPGRVDLDIVNGLATARRFTVRLHGVPAGIALVINGSEPTRPQPGLVGEVTAVIDLPPGR